MAKDQKKAPNGPAEQEAPRATKKFKPPRSENLQPPMTPMIDVTFQLLLFFMLTCEFRESEGNIPGTLPSKGNIIAAQSETPPAEPIQVRIRPSQDRASANFEITGVSVVVTSPEELHNILKTRQDRLGPEGKSVPIVIYPSADVPWEFVVEAFNQAVRAKFEKIAFAEQIL